MANDPKVKKALDEAFDLSLKTKLERGGWIYWNRKSGQVFAIIKDPPTRISTLNVPRVILTGTSTSIAHRVHLRVGRLSVTSTRTPKMVEKILST